MPHSKQNPTKRSRVIYSISFVLDIFIQKHSDEVCWLLVCEKVTCQWNANRVGKILVLDSNDEAGALTVGAPLAVAVVESSPPLKPTLLWPVRAGLWNNPSIPHSSQPFALLIQWPHWYRKHSWLSHRHWIMCVFVTESVCVYDCLCVCGGCLFIKWLKKKEKGTWPEKKWSNLS